MKKTLFAVAALALCGTAVAGEYNASDYVGQNFDYMAYRVDWEQGSEVVFNVNQPATLNTFNVDFASSATLNFVGTNTLSVTSIVNLRVNFNAGTLAITGDNDAKIHWGESLTSSAGEVKTLTLASTTGTFNAPDSASFEGLTESGSITLGDAALTYMGFHKVANAGAAEALIKGDNQIALVAIGGDGGPGSLALVGKGAAATPEPATATLSLMALAGLASRRRRK